MILTNQDLVGSIEAIKALQAERLPVRSAHAIGLAIHRLEPYLNAYNDSVNRIKDELPGLKAEKPKDDASAGAKEAFAKEFGAAIEAFNTQVAELLKAEFEFEQKALPLSVLNDRDGKEIEIDVKHMQALWWLFEETPAG